MAFVGGDCRNTVGYFPAETQKQNSPKIYGLYNIHDKLY